MSNESNIHLDAVTKLIKLTQEKKIVWRLGDTSPVQNNHPTHKVNSVFVTEYDGKRLRLYKTVFVVKVNKSSWLSTRGVVFSGGEVPDEYEDSRTVLEIVDRSSGNSLWQFPYVNAISDLLKTVQFQVSGAPDLLNKLLNEN